MAFFLELQRKIDDAILDHFAQYEEGSILKEAALYALMSGGRRIRPVISLLMAESLGCPEEEAMGPALAVEFFHTASLIADDLPCMDDDALRRGKPSTHAKFGEAAAILTTYALISDGYRLFSELKPHLVPLLLKETAAATGFLGASEGQLQDLNLPNRELSTMEEMIKKKTGALFELSFTSGWIAGNGDPSQLSRIRRAASHFGTAFQIYDDLQDREQDSPNLANSSGLIQAGLLFEQSLDRFMAIIKELNLGHSKILTIADIFFVKVNEF